MKKQSTLFAALFFTYCTYAQTKIPADSANSYIGKSVIVCSKVYGVKELEKVNFINVGSAYPNSPLTIVIFAKDRKNFKSLSEYQGKTICVTGKIEEYKGKPQIVVSKAEEIVTERRF